MGLAKTSATPDSNMRCGAACRTKLLLLAGVTKAVQHMCMDLLEQPAVRLRYLGVTW